MNFKEQAEGYFKSGLSALANNHPRNEKQIAVMKWGILAELSKAEIKSAIESHWGDGRQPDDRELERAYDVALESAGQPPEPARTGESKEARAKRKEAERARRALEIERGKVAALEAMEALAPVPMTFEELIDKSPVPLRQFCLEDHPVQAAALFLRVLYTPEDKVFCGADNLYGVSQKNAIRGAYELSESILDGDPLQPFIVCNPLSGKLAPTRGGKGRTYRGDNCVSSYRYTVFESDIAPLETQAAFLWGRIQAGWPIASITYSGGRSLHALIRVDGVKTAEQWKQEIRESLFPFLVMLGADRTCANPSRLTRLPGHHREGGKLQSLIYLNPAYGGIYTTTPATPEPSITDTTTSDARVAVTKGVESETTTAQTNTAGIPPDIEASMADILRIYRLRLSPVEAITRELCESHNLTEPAVTLILERLTASGKVHTFTDPEGIKRVAIAGNFEAPSPCQCPQNLRTGKGI